MNNVAAKEFQSRRLSCGIDIDLYVAVECIFLLSNDFQIIL